MLWYYYFYLPNSDYYQYSSNHCSVSFIAIKYTYYGLKSLVLDKRTTLVLSNTRELDRDPFTK